MTRLTIASAIASLLIIAGYAAHLLPFEYAILFFLWLILVGVNRKETDK